MPKSGSEVTNMTRIPTLNMRSFKNKDHFIVNELHDYNVGIAIITET